MEDKRKICFVVSDVYAARSFFKEHFVKLSKEFDIYFVANFKDEEYAVLDELAIKGHKHISIERKINIFKDLKALFLLWKYINKMDFWAIHSATPKASLITALAGKFSKIKFRITIFTGQVWATKSGMMKKLLMLMDRIVVKFDTHILVDGYPQQEFLIKNKILNEGESVVLGNGSIAGINVDRFIPSVDIRKKMRSEIGVDDNKVVFAFIGRFNYDKGVEELFEAFSKLYLINNNVFLLLIGADEEGYIEKLNTHTVLKNHINYHYYGYTNTPEVILQASDVSCLPSHREAFGIGILESSCLELPIICSDIYGLRDTIVDNVTGIRHKVADIDSLFDAMLKLSNDEKLRKELGKNGRQRVIKSFSSEYVTNEWLNFYLNLK